MKTLYTNKQIQDSVDEQVLWLNRNLEPREPLWVIGILNGAYQYIHDVVRRLENTQVVVDFIRIDSYDGQQKKELKFEAKPKNILKGVPILLLDDIFDSGETISKAEEYLIDTFNPRVIFTMTAFNKRPGVAPYRNLGLPVNVEDFVVGYGLDNKEFDRNLSNLYAL